MTNVCDNEKCSYHTRLLTSDARAPYVYVAEGDERVKVYRHIYRSLDSQHEFYLCDVCHAAAQMVRSKPKT